MPFRRKAFLKYYRENKEELNKLFRSKKKLAVWLVSDCETFSEREKYVAEMQKYIDIDIYGKCGPLSCGHRSDCDEIIQVCYS